jgi:hypothetical protein
MVEPPLPAIPAAPRPKKKKKKKAVAVAQASDDSFMSKMMAMPIELWIIAVCAIFFLLGFASPSMAGIVGASLALVGFGVMFWGNICIAIAAFAEGAATGLMYLFLPFYWLIFILSNWSEVQRHVGRTFLGGIILIAGMVGLARAPDDTGSGSGSGGGSRVSARATKGAAVPAAGDEEPAPENFSTNPAYVIYVDLEEPPGEEADETALQKKIAAAIEDSLKKRSMKPLKGKWIVHASVEHDADRDLQVSMPMGGREWKMPAPKVVCQLTLLDGRENTLFEKSSSNTANQDLIEDAIKNRGDDRPTEAIQKALWKNVAPDFGKLADAIPPASSLPGANAADAATDQAGSPAPDGSAADGAGGSTPRARRPKK